MTSAPSAPHPRDGHVDPDPSALPVEATGPDVVELVLPADPAYLGVVRTACAEAAGWPHPLRVSVNLSTALFTGQDAVTTSPCHFVRTPDRTLSDPCSAGHLATAYDIVAHG